MKSIVHKFILRPYIGTRLCSILVLALFVPFIVEAQALVNPLAATSLVELLEAIVGVLIKIGIPIAAMFIVYAGFLFVTARGNEKKVEDAKLTIKYTVIGAAILLGAWAIVLLVVETVGELT